MKLTTAILIGLKEIWAHKFRSLLTILGIVLGVASLVTMAAIVKGMEEGMKDSLVAMGGLDKVLIREDNVPVHQEHLRDQAPGRTMRDVHALRNNAAFLKAISPEIRLRGARISRAGESIRPAEVVGVWPSVLEMNLHQVEHGRFFTDLDEEYAHSVCVIGTGIRDRLFGNPEETGEEIIPIGQKVLINGQVFTIVGMFTHYVSEQEKRMRSVAKEKDEGSGVQRQGGWRSQRWDPFWRKNNTVYMPLRSMWLRFQAASGENEVPARNLTDIDVKVERLNQMEAALQQVRNVMMVTHNGIEDFSFRTQEDDLAEIKERIRNARLSGGIIAALSLIVGGVGIMNIMLASINERIREIGTCKAIGATNIAVFIQILVESVVVALMGALAGLGAARGLVCLVTIFSVAQETSGSGYSGAAVNSVPIVTPEAMLLGVGFSVLVGIAAGLFPAYKAAKLDPIQALRYE